MKNKKNNKNFTPQNQKSFYFDDFLETNLKHKKLYKSQILEDRFYILFFIFFSLILVFSISILSISLQKPSFQKYKEINQYFLPLRRDVVDRNGELIARNINSYHAAIKPNLIKNKETFIFNIKLNFPEISLVGLKKNLEDEKYFYLKKRLTED